MKSDRKYFEMSENLEEVVVAGKDGQGEVVRITGEDAVGNAANTPSAAINGMAGSRN